VGIKETVSTIVTVTTELGNNVVRTGKFFCEFTEYYSQMEELFGKT
jgi:hypothetical protein